MNGHFKQQGSARDAGSLRICMLVHDLSATGVVRNALALSAHLSRSMDVDLITLRGAGVLVSDVDRAVRLVQLTGNPLTRLWQLRQRLAANRADVLVSAGNRGHLFGWIASLGLSRLRRIYRLSNSFAHQRGGKGLHLRLRSLGRWLTLMLIGRQADLLIANSPSLAREIRSRLTASIPLVVVPNGVDIDGVRKMAREPGIPIKRKSTDVPLVLAIGRLVEQKNHETLIDALAIANRNQPMDLVIVGTGTRAARQRLEQRATTAGIADRLYLVPPSPNPFPIMRDAGLFVIPSWWEGASNALLEALACGLPVVASDRAGSAHDVLAFGRYGLLVDPSDAEGLANAMLMQLSECAVMPSDRATRYDLSIMLAKYEALVRRVFVQPRRARGFVARPASRVGSSEA